MDEEESRAAPGSGDDEQQDRANIFDVAREAGVSFVTVSRVYNGHPNVSRQMRERVLRTASRIGYKPKLVTRPKQIALLVGDPNRFLSATDMNHICCRIMLAAAGRDFSTRILSFEQAEELARHSLDGVIEVESGGREIQDWPGLSRLPVVLTQQRTTHPAFSSVTVDYEQEGRLALDHLLGLGHRRIALLFEDPDSWTSRSRLRGARALLQQRGIDRDALLPLNLSRLDLPHLESHLRREKVGAVVNFSSDHVLPLLDQLFNHSRLRIPEDLSLLSLDNTPATRHYHPRVSAIRQNLEELAHGATAELLRRMTRSSRNRNLLIPSLLEDRHSCAPPPP